MDFLCTLRAFSRWVEVVKKKLTIAAMRDAVTAAIDLQISTHPDGYYHFDVTEEQLAELKEEIPFPESNVYAYQGMKFNLVLRAPACYRECKVCGGSGVRYGERHYQCGSAVMAIEKERDDLKKANERLKLAGESLSRSADRCVRALREQIGIDCEHPDRDWLEEVWRAIDRWKVANK